MLLVANDVILWISGAPKSQFHQSLGIEKEKNKANKTKVEIKFGINLIMQFVLATLI